MHDWERRSLSSGVTFYSGLSFLFIVVKLFTFRKCRSLAVACLTLAAAIEFFGQRSSFDRPRVYDVKNYIIRVRFDRSKKLVYGDTTVELTPLNFKLSTIDLDAVDLNFTSVRLDGGTKDLLYTAGNGHVSVKLDSLIKPGESISVRLKYTIKNPKKVSILSLRRPPNDEFKHPAQIWSQNEPGGARYWFPSFDFPSDKATSEEFITAPKGDVAVGNGRFIDTKTNTDGTTTFRFRMEVPHSTYLTSFVVGNFAKLIDEHKDVPLGFYAYKDLQHIAGTAFAGQRHDGQLRGPDRNTFPFAKYDQIMVSGFQQFDGMENVTATTLADSNILFAELPLGRPLVEDSSLTSSPIHGSAIWSLAETGPSCGSTKGLRPLWRR